MSEVKHSQLGASSAKRWLNCPGSVALCATVPQQSSTYANEGSAAHYVAEKCLREGKDAKHMRGRMITIEDPVKGIVRVECTDEMVEAVQVYLDVVRADQAEVPVHTLIVEHRFCLDWLDPELFGTNDACLGAPFGALRVYDYKHGAGVPVPVEDAQGLNPQLLYYALGAVGQDNPNNYTHVELVIVQPRCREGEPVRRATITVPELHAWARDVLLPGVAATRSPGAPLVCGDAQCKFCDARAICPAQRDAANALAQNIFSPVASARPKGFTPPAALNDDQLLLVLRHGPMVQDWISEVFAHAQGKLERGEDVPGWKLVRGKANRIWKNESEAESFLAHALKQDAWTRKVVSPAQAEKQFKALGRDPDELGRFIIKPEGKVVLAPVDDKREAVNAAAAAGFAPVHSTSAQSATADWL